MSGPGPSRVEAAEGFADLVATRHAPMLTMARALVRHDADAEDLVHDVLASALLKWRRVSAADDPAAYVNRMLVNAALSWWRRPARRERPADREAEIAEVLRMAPSTVRSCARRGLSALRAAGLRDDVERVG